jgi:hypothetical protein
MMNLETFAIESDEMLATHQAADPAWGQAPEITPLALESFKLVGGGTAILLD